MKRETIRVAVTGAAGQISYSLLFRIASGEMLGPDQPIHLSLLEIPQAVGALEGVVMELEDSAEPLLKGISIGSDPHKIFEGVEIALLVGAKPRGPGMQRADLLRENGAIFEVQGKAIDQVAAPHAKILVVGNPCNTNALIALHQAKRIPKRNFMAMTRLDENRAKAAMAQKAGVPLEEVEKLVIWGNHSDTMVPDFVNAEIRGKPPAAQCGGEEWLKGPFLEKVRKRGGAIIAARQKSSSASAAKAAIDTIRDLYLPREGQRFSLGVYSAGNPYGIQENLVYSFPCISRGKGEWEWVSGLSLDSFIRAEMKKSEDELASERAAILGGK